MPDEHDADDLDPGNIRNTQPHDARPFVVALVGFVIVAVAAFFFLREDDDLTVVRPDSLSLLAVAGDNVVELTAEGRPACEQVERVQVDSDDDTIFLELVVKETDGCESNAVGPLTVTVTLPEAVDDRRVVPGVGRRHIPCDVDGDCRPGQ